MKVRLHRRSAFSLIEILVVLAIISVLVVLTAGATIQVMAQQRASNTENLIRRLNSTLDRQWQAVVDQARKETIPPEILEDSAQVIGLMTMAGGNPERARVIWIKLRLKQQFPVSFYEVAEGPIPRNYKAGLPASPPFYFRLPAPPAYVRALQGILAPSNQPTYAGESSTCLLMALSQARSGITFDADSLAAHEVADLSKYVPAFTGAPNRVGGIDLKLAVDAWGTPLEFYRWPTYSAGQPNPSDPAFELDSSFVGLPGSTSATIRDPLDPQGLLRDPTWNNIQTRQPGGGACAFEQMLHPISKGTGTSAIPYSYYTVPVIVSAGKNEITNPGLGFGLAKPNRLLHNPMNLAPSPIGALSSDNIYSFRLRQGARGD